MQNAKTKTKKEMHSSQTWHECMRGRGMPPPQTSPSHDTLLAARGHGHLRTFVATSSRVAAESSRTATLVVQRTWIQTRSHPQLRCGLLEQISRFSCLRHKSRDQTVLWRNRHEIPPILHLDCRNFHCEVKETAMCRPHDDAELSTSIQVPPHVSKVPCTNRVTRRTRRKTHSDPQTVPFHFFTKLLI